MGHDPVNWIDPQGLSEETFLYQKLGANGEHLKYGITNNPVTRYAAKELTGGKLKILAQGSREEMLALERNLHKTLPLGSEERQCAYRGIQQRNGLKVFGVLGLVSQILGFMDAEERANEHGISVWNQMIMDVYDAAGYTVIYPEDQSI